MSRKISLIVILFIYLLVGVAGLVYVISNGTVSKPENASIEPSKVTVSKPEATATEDEGPSFDGLESYDDFFETSADISVADDTIPEEVATADELFTDDTPVPAENAQAYTFVATHDKGRLFIRDIPSMDGNIIGHMYRGQTGDVIEDGDGWIHAKYKDVTGYISKEYVELVPVEESEE